MADRPVSDSDSQFALGRLLQLARSDLARELTEDADPDQLIMRVARLASRLIPRTDGCVIALSVNSEPMVALAETDPLGDKIIAAEIAAAEGPTTQAMGSHGTLRIDDTRQESRWPHLCGVLADLGVLSVGVCDLPVTRRSRGALVVYSSAARSFDDVAELMLPVFASRASIALGYRDSLRTLSGAVRSRQMIGQAVGILMERHRLTEEAAFQRLVRASQTSQLKLRAIAERVVRTGQEPDDTHG